MSLNKKTKDILSSMSKEDLLKEIYTMSDKISLVSEYLNNILNDKKLPVDDLVDQITDCFIGRKNDPNLAEKIYYEARQTSRDYHSLSILGITLIGFLLCELDYGRYSPKKAKQVRTILECTLEDISKLENPKEFQADIESLWNGAPEYFYDDFGDIYYSYYEDRIEE